MNSEHSRKSDSKPIRIYIRANGVNKKILSILHSDSSGLMFVIKSAETTFDMEQNEGLNLKFRTESMFSSPARNSKHSKISVHYTSKNPDFNVIKLYQTTCDGSEKTISGITSAIKSKDRFAFVFTRSCASFEPAHYNLTASGKYNDICIGQMDCSKTTLMYSIYVSSPDVDYRFLESIQSTTALVLSIGRFHVLIMASLITMPSYYKVFTSYFPVMERYSEEMEDMSTRELFKEFAEAGGFEGLDGNIDDAVGFLENSLRGVLVWEKYCSDTRAKIQALIEVIEREVKIRIDSKFVYVQPVLGMG